MQNHNLYCQQAHRQQQNSDQSSNRLIFFKGQHHQISSLFNFPQFIQNSIIDPNRQNHQNQHHFDQHIHLDQSFCTEKKEQHNKSKQSKNKNLMKFILKLLRDFPHIVKDIFGTQYQSSYLKMDQYISELFAWQKIDPKKNNINSAHLHHIIYNHQEGDSSIRSIKARQALSTIISENMSQIVTKNKRCNQKLIYLNALKVYQLRCRNAKTALRLQSSQ